MPDIVLTTLNAKYAHASFGLRYLLANLGDLRDRATILEFEISQRPLDVVEAVLAQEPKIVGVGVYIWNAEQALRVVADLKRIRPDLIVVLGGPEVSHETDRQEIVALADYVVTGEADLAFAELCGKLLVGRRPLSKIIPADLPEFATKNARPTLSLAPVRGGEGRGEGTFREGNNLPDGPSPQPSPLSTGERECGTLQLPYDLYDDTDIAHRVIYVEASRGCPFKCEFCLSSLDVPVRNAPLETFLPAMDRLFSRGVRHFKFVDRTFNLNLNISRAILDFFWQRYEPGLFLHFEMIPDRLPEALREPIRQFPPGALQFEVGIQTFNDDVAARISRRQDTARLSDNLRFLREQTGVHVHADLIVGLPGEDITSFGVGFDRLVELGPQEIQVGILKRLRGTPIVRHDAEWGMVYSPHPPYEVLNTNQVDFATMQRMRRFSRFWDLVANSGNFRDTTPMLWATSGFDRDMGVWSVMMAASNVERVQISADLDSTNGGHDRDGNVTSNCRDEFAGSPFWRFLEFCDWLYARLGRNHAIALPMLAESIFRYLIDVRGQNAQRVADSLWADYQRGGRSDRPEFLKSYIPEPDRGLRKRTLEDITLRRQARHLAK